jgi:Arc/MetJ-type ribon-helix-helix transcriptional regulator
MKVSISLSPEEVAVLDSYAASASLGSRSAAVQHAVRLLQLSALEDDYAAAFEEWDASGEREAWDSTVGDGLAPATRTPGRAATRGAGRRAAR